MAVQSVQRQGFRLPLDDVNRAQLLVEQASSIIGVIGSAATSNDAPSGGEISSACYAVREMIEELGAIVSRREGDAP